MAVWGIDKGNIDEDRLKPLGLICYGGTSTEKVIQSTVLIITSK